MVPLAFMVGSFGLPLAARVGLALYLVGLDLLFALLIFRVRDARSWLFALIVASVFTAIEIADSLLPMWGTARSLARAWSVFPRACGLIQIGGTPLIGFIIVGVQALAVMAARRRQRGTLLATAMGVGLAVLVSVTPGPAVTRMLKVAAVGWGQSSDASNAEARVSEASAAGARVVVFPEAAFEVSPGGRAEMEARWSRWARDRGVWLVIPFLEGRTANRVALFDPTGKKRGEYAKHHRVPLAEPFSSGAGSLLVFEVDGVSVGVMICQDDNFRDIARAYARRGVQLVVVPTFEGPPSVAPYHLRNSVLRTIENPIALVRATAQGQSAAIAPGGSIVAVFDHARDGAGVLVADVPIAERGRGPEVPGFGAIKDW
jgi:apolipoprotein N-acyltransferase